MDTVTLSCRCGQCRIELDGPPILTVICHCASCRAAGVRIEALEGAVPERTGDGATPYVLHRKDRLRPTAGVDHLAGFRLTPGSKTRRAVATCCNSFFFTDFQSGHWLSVSAARWPEATRPAPQMHTMAGEARGPDSDDLPRFRSLSPVFVWRLIRSRLAMGLRTPKLDFPRRELTGI